MSFTAADVKTLREMTSVGMMDCKKALTECDGDMDKAVEYLREKGLAKAAKKAGRIAAEGMAYAAVMDGVGVVVEVNAETDFVGKNEKIQGVLDDSHVAFYDIMDLTRQFKIKNKKAEIDELVVKLKAKYDRSA